MLDRAMKIDAEAAISSVSWGVGHVMGAHWDCSATSVLRSHRRRKCIAARCGEARPCCQQFR
ncbi:N-acetylmuramidase domain-containing protein [Mesorhizobium liriopis]|uniref:N-acetylmuramidase domain-containing protein n=1 Tax=Mesorhizobium liriopis TaxID=2953882 RepID=UPI00338FFB76